MEHDEHAQELEREAEKLEQHSDVIGGHIDDARQDWKAKEKDPAVPGAQAPDDQEEEESVTETPKPSEQLPEEGPAEIAPDDAPGNSEREPSPGVRGEDGTATGNPDAAGADDEGSDDEEDPAGA